MKTIKILIAAGCISISGIGMAQDVETDNREKMKLGLKAGLNYSNVYDSKTEDFSAASKFGFAGGAFLSIPIGKYLGVQPEILISQKGFKGEGMLFESSYSFTRTTTYIDFPLQIALKPSEFITIVAGPQYSYLIKQKDVFNSTLMSFFQEQEFNNDNIRKNIFGFVVGMDLNLNHIVLGTRLGWDITNNHGDGSSSTPQYRNVWLQATIGYAF